MNRGKEKPDTLCPRCGYDQRGVVETWRESCPLRGRCAECGLEFAWVDVLRPDLHGAPWCVENAPRVRAMPGAAVKTLGKSFLPWRFWSQLKMSHEIRWRRLFGYIAQLLTPLILLYVLVQGGVAVALRYQMQKSWNESHQLTKQQQASQLTTFQSMHLQLQQWLDGELEDSPYLETMREQIPGSVPEEDREEFLRTHVREEVIPRSNELIATLQNASPPPPPPVINMSYAAAIYEAVVTPFKETSSGSGVYWGGVYPYPSPAQIWPVYIQNVSLNQIGYLSFHESAQVTAWALAAGAGAGLFLPACLFLLPISLRRAKVRWGHIARVYLYSLYIPIMLFYGAALLLLAHLLVSATGEVLATMAVVIAMFGSWLMLMIWWMCAIKYYLRISHAIAVTIAATVITGLIVGGSIVMETLGGQFGFRGISGGPGLPWVLVMSFFAAVSLVLWLIARAQSRSTAER